MADALKCPKCGSENPKNNKFCDSCGYKLSAGAPPKEEPKKPAAAAAKQAEKPEKPEKKKAEKAKAAVKDEEIASYGEPEEAEAPAAGFALSWESVLWFGIIVLTVLTRFYDLGAKPLHHDESMHAFYAWKLFMGNGYSYNPMMHGPFHYHINALVYFLFGANDYTSRVAPATYGLIGVLLIYFLKPYLGKKGTLATAFIMAVSPMFMYQARFIREDIFMAIDTLAMFIGLVRYFDSRKPSWLYLAAFGLALSWATKEATYITLFVLGTFFIGRYIWEYSMRANEARLDEEGKIYPTVRHWLGKGGQTFIWALVVFVVTHALLYFNKEPLTGIQGFFKNAKGIIDGYIWALTYWLGQHSVERGSQPGYYYWLLIPFYEMLPVLFMSVASIYYLAQKEKRTFFNLVLIWWWILSMFVYSWAGERMPWLAIHPLLPMIILAGKFFGEILDGTVYQGKAWVKDVSIALFVLLSMASVHGAWNTCFFGSGAHPRESFIYVQSSVDCTKVRDKIVNLANEVKDSKWDSGEFRSFDPYNLEMAIEDYCSWPFAWYLRDFKRIAYPPKMIPDGDVGKAIILSGIEEAAPGHDQKVKEMLTSETKIVNGKTVQKKPEEIYVATRYKLREWWAPDEKKWWSAPFDQKMDMLYKRFMYREVWNDLGSYDFVVYVRKDLEKYWR